MGAQVGDDIVAKGLHVLVAVHIAADLRPVALLSQELDVQADFRFVQWWPTEEVLGVAFHKAVGAHAIQEKAFIGGRFAQRFHKTADAEHAGTQPGFRHTTSLCFKQTDTAKNLAIGAADHGIQVVAIRAEPNGIAVQVSPHAKGILLRTAVGGGAEGKAHRAWWAMGGGRCGPGAKACGSGETGDRNRIETGCGSRSRLSSPA